MGRKAMKDITLSDGTRIPKGTEVYVNMNAQHHDAALLAGTDADTFDAFRYARMRAASGEGESLKNQFTSTSPEFVAFGHGQHAWCVADTVRRVLSLMIAFSVTPAARGGTSRRTS